MSVYYNKKLISGVRDVPQMTLAQYNALTNKPDLWLRTDAPESDRGISASDVEYSTGVSVKDKIDEISGNPNYKIEVGNYPITYNEQTGSVIGIKITVLSNNRYMIIGTELAGGTLGGGSFVYNSWIDKTVRFAI